MATPQSTTIHRTYQLRGYCSCSGYGRIREVLRVCQQLYNRALAERKAVYRLTGNIVGKFTQIKWLTHLRRESQIFRDIDVKVERGVLMRLDRAFQSFFRRIKNGEKPGFPRFKPIQRYTCIELAEVRSGMVKGNRIKIKGLPIIRIRPNRDLPDSSRLKSLRLVMHGRILTVDLVYAESVVVLPESTEAVGIDLGVNERMALSNGDTVARRMVNRNKERQLQRSISRKKKGSNGRKKAVAAFARENRRNSIRNRNECHRITTALVNKYGLIAVERLRVQSMTRGNRGLNREILSQTWGILKEQLVYKAEWAGRKVVEVNPAYTSRICSECGFVNGKAREYRMFECSGCGHCEDRDVNAAKNILRRGREFAAGSTTVGVVNPCSAARMVCQS